jgi:type IV pilus assembly protein PilN
MIRINLLPKEERKEIKGIGEFITGILVIIAVLVVIVATHLIQIKRIRDINNKIARVEKEIKKLEEVKKKVDEFKAKNKELEDKIKIIAVLEENRTGPMFVMDALARAIPDRSWIDKFSEKSYVAKMEGVAWDEFTVADFMKGLQSSPYFQNVELKAIKTKEMQNLPLRTFVIESRLNYSGKTQEKSQWKEPETKQETKAK